MTFTPTDTTDYTTVTQTTTIDVNQATPTISWPAPAAITYGTALGSTQLDATASVPGTFRLHAGAGTVLSAGNEHAFGDLHAHGYDGLHHGHADDHDRREPGHAHDQLARAGGDHLWDGAGRNAVGRQRLLDSGRDLNDRAGYFHIRQAGTVLTAGSGQTLSVTFTPTDTTDYATPAAQTTTIDVNQATPTINWPAQTITYGTA